MCIFIGRFRKNYKFNTTLKYQVQLRDVDVKITVTNYGAMSLTLGFLCSIEQHLCHQH